MNKKILVGGLIATLLAAMFVYAVNVPGLVGHKAYFSVYQHCFDVLMDTNKADGSYTQFKYLFKVTDPDNIVRKTGGFTTNFNSGKPQTTLIPDKKGNWIMSADEYAVKWTYKYGRWYRKETKCTPTRYSNSYMSICGDSITEYGEECDDGNTANGDGCDYLCLNEYCGNGVRETETGETCDDNNNNNGDGCDSSCQTEATWTCQNTIPNYCYNPSQY